MDWLVLGVFGGVLRAPISSPKDLECYALKAETHGDTSILGLVYSTMLSCFRFSPQLP